MIKFSPIYSENLKVKASKKGDIYTINGVDYDFSPLLDGEVLPHSAVGCEFIISDVCRVGTELNFTLMRPYIGNDKADCFPTPHDNTVDGVIL